MPLGYAWRPGLHNWPAVKSAISRAYDSRGASCTSPLYTLVRGRLSTHATQSLDLRPQLAPGRAGHRLCARGARLDAGSARSPVAIVSDMRSPPVTQPSPAPAPAEVALWRAVMVAAAVDALSDARALRWWWSPDAELVADWAGVDPDLLPIAAKRLGWNQVEGITGRERPRVRRERWKAGDG